jgi:hypothetical protein
MNSLNGEFARIFGTGVNQVLVFLTASSVDGTPVIFVAANAQAEGYATISAEMAVAKRNLNDQTAVAAQTEAFLAGLTEAEAFKLADQLRDDFKSQFSTLFAQSMGVVN